MAVPITSGPSVANLAMPALTTLAELVAPRIATAATAAIPYAGPIALGVPLTIEAFKAGMKYRPISRLVEYILGENEKADALIRHKAVDDYYNTHAQDLKNQLIVKDYYKSLGYDKTAYPDEPRIFTPAGFTSEHNLMDITHNYLRNRGMNPAVLDNPTLTIWGENSTAPYLLTNNYNDAFLYIMNHPYIMGKATLSDYNPYSILDIELMPFPLLADALYNVSEPKLLELDFGETVDTSSESIPATSSPTPNDNNPEDNKNDDNTKEETKDNKNSGNVKEETENTNKPKGGETRDTNPKNEGPNLNDKYKNFKIRDIQRALKNARRDGDVEKVNELSEVLNGISRMKRIWAPIKPWAIGIGGAGGAYGIYQAIKALSKDNKKEEKNKYWDPNIAEADLTGINLLDTILVRSTPTGNDTILAVFPKNPIDNSPNKEAIIFRDPVTGKLSNDTVRIEDAWKYRDFNMKKISNTANSYSLETFGNDD